MKSKLAQRTIETMCHQAGVDRKIEISIQIYDYNTLEGELTMKINGVVYPTPISLKTEDVVQVGADLLRSYVI